MDDTTITTCDLLRLIGIMAICVGLAWALQTIGFSGAGSAGAKMTWILLAASVAGAGSGLIVASNSLPVEAKAKSRA